MNNEQENPQGASALNVLLKRLLAALTNRWGWKLASLLCAVALWGGMIMQDETLTRDKVFVDVPISVSGSDTLTRSGLIVVSGLEDLAPVRLRVAVPQKMYDTANASLYSVRIDLSKIKTPGEQTVPVIATSSTAYGTVIDISQEQIQVRVEPYLSRSRISVRVAVTGDVPEGFYASTPSVDPPYVTVSGPQSLVQDIAYCTAEYSLSLLSAQAGIERTSVPFTLYNSRNEPVDSRLIRVSLEAVTLDNIVVNQALYNKKTVPVSTVGVLEGEVAQGYEVVSVLSQPENVSVAGNPDMLAALSSLYLTGTVDVSGATQPLTRALPIGKPSSAEYVSADIAYVTVMIAPVGH